GDAVAGGADAVGRLVLRVDAGGGDALVAGEVAGAAVRGGALADLERREATAEGIVVGAPDLRDHALVARAAVGVGLADLQALARRVGVVATGRLEAVARAAPPPRALGVVIASEAAHAVDAQARVGRVGRARGALRMIVARHAPVAHVHVVAL